MSKLETIDACIWGSEDSTQSRSTSSSTPLGSCPDAAREVVVPSWAKEFVRKLYKSTMPSRKIPRLKFIEAVDPRSFGGLWLPGEDGRGQIAVFDHPDRDFTLGVLAHECCHDFCDDLFGDTRGDHGVDFLRLVEVIYIDCKIPAHVARKIEAKSPSTRNWSW
jgi:hypothetical protein